MSDKLKPILERLADSGPFGFGGSSLGNLYRVIGDAQSSATVQACWDAGVRYFDTAPFYGFGLAERRLGDALRSFERKDFILSTKVGRLLQPAESASDKFGFCSPMPFDPVFDYGYDGVMRSVEASLHRLGLARIDILYMHDIGRATHGADHDRLFAIAMDGGYRAMAELREQGIVEAIGLGVNEVEVCEETFAHADFDLFMVAGRHTMINQDAAGFLDECARRDVGVVAAGIFNSGILATGVSGVGQPHYDYGPAPADVVARVAEIEDVCDAWRVPLPAAAFAFASAHPAIACAVIGTGSASRVVDMVALAHHAIPSEFWDALQSRGLMAADAQGFGTTINGKWQE